MSTGSLATDVDDLQANLHYCSSKLKMMAHARNGSGHETIYYLCW